MVVSFTLPWATFGGFEIRPTNRIELWIPIVVVVPIVLAAVLAGRWRYTRWMGLVPLMGGFFLIGIDLGVAGAVLVLNPLLTGLPWERANEIVDTVSRLASVARISSDELNLLQGLVSRFAQNPQISMQIGSWLYAASCLALIVVGYRKVVETFSPPAIISVSSADQMPVSTTTVQP